MRAPCTVPGPVRPRDLVTSEGWSASPRLARPSAYRISRHPVTRGAPAVGQHDVSAANRIPSKGWPCHEGCSPVWSVGTVNL